mgnify:CR=1 FL=1
MNNGKLYWITGLAGAGKTTLGTLLYNEIKMKRGGGIFLLDGDIARRAYNDSIGYNRQDREIGAYRNSRVCKMLTDQDISVVCCTISMFQGVREWNRKNISNYREIFIDVPMDVLIARDKKNLYSQVRNGKMKNVAGLDLEVEFPQSPDLRIVNDGSKTPKEILQQILRAFPEFDGWEVS